MSEKFSQDPSEWAALHALDALTPEEKAAYIRYLENASEEEAAQLRALLEVAGQLGFAPPRIDPPVSLRERLLKQTAGSPEPPADQAEPQGDSVLLNEGGLLIARSDALPWQPGGLPGVHVKRLFLDPQRNYLTALVRMDAGAIYPSHRHKDIEEVYLLEGDLLVQGMRMQAGDYCRAEPSSLHSQVSTESGATFLAMFSTENELFT